MAENVIFSQNAKKCFFPPKKAKNVKHYVKCENIEIRPLHITIKSQVLFSEDDEPLMADHAHWLTYEKIIPVNNENDGCYAYVQCSQ